MPTDAMPSGTTPHHDPVYQHTIVIGSGPAGLAVGACLRQAGVPCLILEQADKVASAWHRHYDRLQLHTAKAYSSLPFVPFPGHYPRYPSRLQVISYLEAYARRFRLDPLFGQRVLAARHLDGLWDVQTQDARYQALNLVIATGYNREPRVPRWPGQDSFRGSLLHSSQYRNGAPFRNQKVLVIGLGNSGGEIAIDLWQHGARTCLAVRGPVNVIPRDLFGIPVQAISILQRRWPPRLADTLNAPLLRAVMGDLARYGLRQLPRGPLAQVHRDARIPLIDVGTINLIKRGQLSVCPGITSFTEEGVLFTDGQHMAFDAVILATGYRPRVSAFLEGAEAAHDEHGAPLSSGREAQLPGLYFCGYSVSPTGMLREIALEAQRISVAIARR